MGYFNIDLLKTENSAITQHTATLIDNIFTNDLTQLDSVINGIIFFDISDHLPIFHLTATKSKHISKHMYAPYKKNC